MSNVDGVRYSSPFTENTKHPFYSSTIGSFSFYMVGNTVWIWYTALYFTDDVIESTGVFWRFELLKIILRFLKSGIYLEVWLEHSTNNK